MKNLYAILITVVLLIPAKLFGDGTVVINERPRFIDLSSDKSQSAVRVTLSGYSTNDVRYRLYNGTTQYNCWDVLSGAYITSNAYADGPYILGPATTSTTFWILFERGTNTGTSASYRDRIGPTYPSNNNTASLPVANEIVYPATISGTLVGSESYPLTNKYVVLGFSGEDLYYATSSDITSGTFSLSAQDGVSCDRIEIRTQTNITITSISGLFYTTMDVGNIELTSGPDVTPPNCYPSMKNIDATQADLEVEMNEAGKAYYVVVPDGATAPTAAEVVAGVNYGTVTVTAHGTIDVIEGDTPYSATITGLTDKTNYDIYVVAEDDETPPNRQTDPVMVELYTIRPPDVLVNADFEEQGSLYPFVCISIVGEEGWTQSEATKGNGYAKMNGYSGSAKDNIDWLISPTINLDASEMNKLSFNTAKNYSGPDLKAMISSNFDGTFTADGVAAATWTDISSNFSFSSGSAAWVESGELSLSAYTGIIYIAFLYESTTAGAAEWRVDDFKVTGYIQAGSDASLSDLQVDGVTIEGFDPAKLDYKCILEAGTTVVPTVTYTLNDASAAAVLTSATDLSGNADARTTTVVVTAADGITTLTYSIQFNPIIAIADLAALRAIAEVDYDRIYQVTGEVIVTGLNTSQRNQKYVQDVSAGILIDDNDGVITTDYNVGDGLTGLTGTLYDYYDMLEFIPYRDSGVTSSTGNSVTPQEVTVADFKTNFESYEAELVKITGAAFDDANGTATFETKKNYNITVATDGTIVRTVFLTTDITGSVIPYMADVTGIAVWDYSNAKVAPRTLADLSIYSSDATLSDLKVNGTTVTGFAAGTLAYNVSLAAGTTTVPTVTATATEVNATIVITPATSLTGDAAARTTKIDVTSHDKSSVKNYTITFTVATAIENNLSSRFTIYPVPARTEITATGIEDVYLIEIYDVTGNKLITEACEGETMKVIPVGHLARGVYFVRLTSPQGAVMKRFVKE
jgi:hypothetical protein